MVHTLKITYMSSAGNEVRRFMVNEDITDNYDLLVKKIREHFLSLGEQQFQISWIDSEHDCVLISSNEELAQAVASFENGLIKLYIRNVSDSDPPIGMAHSASHQRGILHPNVYCDACQGMIYGHRYKCLKCPDYDLCSSCNNEDKHPYHNMIKIISPDMNPLYANQTFGFEEFFTEMFPNFKQCNIRTEDPSKKRDDEKPGECKNIQESIGKLLDVIQKAYPTVLNIREFDLEAKLSVKKSNVSESEAGEMKNDEQSQSENLQNTPEDEDKKLPPTENKENIHNATPSALSSSVHGGSTNNSVDPEVSVPHDPVASNGTDNSADSGDSVPRDAAVSNDASIADSGVFVPLCPTVSNGMPPTCLSEEAIPQPFAGSRIPADVPNVLQNEESPPSYPDYVILKSLDDMCSMGFSNEGGWLLRLLQANHGNINAVLDLLNC